MSHTIESQFDIDLDFQIFVERVLITQKVLYYQSPQNYFQEKYKF